MGALKKAAPSLLAGNCDDTPEDRALSRQLSPIDRPIYLLMDRTGLVHPYGSAQSDSFLSL